MFSNVTTLLRALVFVAGCCSIGLASADSHKVNDAENASKSAAVIKSDNDTRDYKWLTLDNGLQVLLVSDPKATKAAAALDVNVGAKSDPENRQGLAHFLEHMLFLGTKKYPESGEYQEFISSHGGSHNAYTSFEHTNYFFDVNANYLRESLDRFAQFFVAPLFTARYVEREMNAVESEYRSRLRDDSRRSLDVFQQIINPEHPFTKLSVGNLQTLNGGGTEAAREQLLKFYQQHYSADNMRLVIIGREPVAELQTWVQDLFRAVPKRDTLEESKEPALFKPGSLPKMVSIKPEKDSRNLSVTFPIPTTQEHYKSKPLQYIGNIIGHEGEGSLLSYLKKKDWAEQLSAGAGFEDDSGATFNVVISLTETGLKHYEDVLTLLFQSIARVKEEGIQDWLFKEQSALLATQFRFQEKSQPINYASSLANSMHYYPPEDVLRAGYLMKDYKPELIADFLSYLRPDNALITLMADGKNFPKRSPWYDTPYAEAAVAGEQLKAWQAADVNEAILVPEPNPFVPNNFAMPRIKNPAARPQQLQVGERTRMWWLQDSKFKVPKAQAYFNFHTPLANDTPLHSALSQLYVDLLQDSLNEFSYPAVLAGLQVGVLKHLRGVSVKAGGYSDKQRLLLQRVAQAMAMQKVDPQRFAALKKERIRSWQNAKKQLPYIQVLGAVSETMIKSYWGEDDLIDALRDASIDDLQRFKTRFFETAELDAMVYGNLTQGQAKRLAKPMRKVLAKAAGDAPQQPEVEVVHLQNKQTLQRKLEIDHNDAAVLLYQQAADRSDRTRAMMALTMQILKTDFFQQLRTEQQLGYVVFADAMPVVDVPGAAFVVQSPTAAGAQIYAAIGEFLQAYGSKASTMSKPYFSRQKAALISDLEEQPKNQRGQAGRYWEAISLNDLKFDQRQRLLQILEDTTLPEWREFFEQTLVTNQQRRLLLWSPGEKSAAGLPDSIKSVHSLHKFKEQQSYYKFQTMLK